MICVKTRKPHCNSNNYLVCMWQAPSNVWIKRTIFKYFHRFKLQFLSRRWTGALRAAGERCCICGRLTVIMGRVTETRAHQHVTLHVSIHIHWHTYTSNSSRICHGATRAHQHVTLHVSTHIHWRTYTSNSSRICPIRFLAGWLNRCHIFKTS